MGQVTVVADPWARVGARFRNVQPCELAATCPIAKPCQSLTWERTYEVRAVRPVRHGVCRLHEAGARVVEVEELPIEASLDASKTRGTSARWQPLECRFRGCPNWDRCFPLGAQPGQEYALAKVGGALKCPMGYSLVAVSLRAAPR